MCCREYYYLCIDFIHVVSFPCDLSACERPLPTSIIEAIHVVLI